MEDPIKRKEKPKVKLTSLCETCGMPIRKLAKGSFTAWVFGAVSCNCSKIKVADEEALPDPNAALGEPKPIDDRFEILAEIGEGGMGKVYKVRDRKTDKIFALKKLKKELVRDREIVQRFAREVKTAKSLDHPNLVAVYGGGIDEDGCPYMLQDFVDGKSLAEIFDQTSKIDIDQAIDIASQICESLEYAHNKGVVHRDIKPSNILVSKTESGNDVVQLVDFGIAKVLPTEGKETLNLTRTGEIFGSPAYMSPEQCAGEIIDARSDIYSVGCVLYRALAGRTLFPEDTSVKTVLSHIYDKPLPLNTANPGISQELNLVVMHCLEKDKELRFQNIHELKKDLNSIQEKKKPSVIAISEKKEKKRTRKFRYLKMVPLLLLLLIPVWLISAIGDIPWFLTMTQGFNQQDVDASAKKLIEQSSDQNLVYSHILLASLYSSKDIDKFRFHAEKAKTIAKKQKKKRFFNSASTLLFSQAINSHDLKNSIKYNTIGSTETALSLITDPEIAMSVGFLSIPAVETNRITELDAALAFKNEGFYDEATVFFRKLSEHEKYRKAIDALCEHSTMLRQLGRIEEAIKIEMAIKKKAKLHNGYGYAYLANLAFKKQRLEEAEALCKEAMSLNNSIYVKERMSALLCLIYFETEREKSADTLFNRLNSKDYRFYRYIFGRARQIKLDGQKNRAAKIYDYLLSMPESNIYYDTDRARSTARILWEKANCVPPDQQMKVYQEAEKVINAQSDNFFTVYSKKYLLDELGDAVVCSKFFDYAAEIYKTEKTDDTDFQKVACCHLLSGNLEKAEATLNTDLKQFLKKSDEPSSVLLLRANIKLAKGEYKEAIAKARECNSKLNTSKNERRKFKLYNASQFCQAVAYAKINDIENAKKYFKLSLLTQNFADRITRFKLYKAYSKFLKEIGEDSTKYDQQARDLESTFYNESVYFLFMQNRSFWIETGMMDDEILKIWSNI